MKKRILSMFLVLTMVGSIILNVGPTSHASAAKTAMGITDKTELLKARAVWMNSGRTIDERVNALLSAMTLEEKAAQMVQPEQNSDITPELAGEYSVGSVLSGGGSAPESGNSPKDWANRVNAYKKAALNSRLGIPLIYGVDGVHGHNNVRDTVIFPHNIGISASGNVSLAKEIGAIAAKEIRGTGIQ